MIASNKKYILMWSEKTCYEPDWLKMSLIMINKQSSWFPTRSDTNQAVQPQRMA